jgi:hypothetical protein
MMPEEWPIAAGAADPTAPARAGSRDRLATIRADFFLDSKARLSEQERALMTAMLHCLVGDVADEIRAALPNGWAAANDGSNLDVVDALTSARLLDEPALMALLLRRADEERISAGAKARRGRHDARALQGLVNHESGAISAAAMALILARGRRRDRFDQCLITFDDLPLRSATALAYAVAAALRPEISGRGVAAADREVGVAAELVLAAHDPGRGVDALTAELARLLDEDGHLDDDLILAAAHEGEAGFVGEAIARRAGLPGGTATDELLSASADRVMALFRMADLPRKLVAGLLAGVGDLLGLTDPSQAIDTFDKLTDEQVEAARAWLTATPAYRRALAALGMGHGQRAV